MILQRENFLLHIDRALLMVLALSIPLLKPVVPIIIACMVIRWLFGGRFMKVAAAIKSSRRRAFLALFSVFYIFHVVGLINTDNLQAGMLDLEVKASLLIFPLIFSTMDYKVLEGRWLNRVFMAFLLGCALSILFCLGRAILIWQQTGETSGFFYIALSYFHHPSYLALYLNFAIALCIYMLIEMRDKIPSLTQWLLGLAGFVFMWFIVLLSSKAGILGLIITLFLGMLYLIIRQKLIFQGIVGFLVTITFFFLMINIFPYSVNRLKTAAASVESQESMAPESSEGTATRMLVWRVGVTLAWEHFLTGAGTGDVKDVLIQEYDRQGLLSASEQRLNAHNQFLQTTISLGVIGLIMLILSLLLPLLFSYRSDYFPYFVLLILFGFNLLFESMLETQAGVVFYGFFNALLFFSAKMTPQKSS